MSYADAKAIAPTAIPIIDIASLHEGTASGARDIARQLLEAAETVGFFYIRNHGIPRDLIARTDAIARRFFALPLEEKQKVKVAPWHRGYIKVGEAKMYDTAKIDLKESFIWGGEVAADGAETKGESKLRGPNQWPSSLPEMRVTLNEYFDAANQCGRVLFRAFAANLGLDLDHFTQQFDRPIARGALVFYPPQPPDLGDDQFGVAPHTDYGCLTLLYQDPIGGLQVQGRNGEWVVAHPVEDTLVINIGDLMARWTNNQFKSTPHRVINRSGRSRLSIAVFVDPNYETVVTPTCRDGEPPLYEPVTCGDYIVSRFDASFAYRNKGGNTQR
jgi:isopenicillin N synthase-like dioxygenase